MSDGRLTVLTDRRPRAETLQATRIQSFWGACMNKKPSPWATSLFILLAWAVGASRADASDGGVIVEWNQLLQSSLTGPPFPQTRHYAMMHIAMADAVLAIEGHLRPFHVRAWAPKGASAEAAAAQAAHDVLVGVVFTPEAKLA